MIRFIALATFALVATTSDAWTVPIQKNLQKAAAIATVSGALLGAPLVSHASQFDGTYSDPNHPNCLRVIEVPRFGKTAKISGADGPLGTPGCSADVDSGKKWTLTGRVSGKNIYVDFSPKGGPRNLKGVWDGTGIKWPDGNKWNMKNFPEGQEAAKLIDS
eukprot:CAMPEP_0202505280 /NCGR_PEP_ID=MMETSP1361-20130828/46832_1 /ASSEMBLY_ACC=CAM_ASM_000849 /TAXON_ID=210615 /ORGANISM="Staurosira complex sp., Strain CCMP2646" /LENGTH=160 /DNA_ID=CAMNT_0049138983 /DNA_START=19 /DNA_END=501 /DNA_ORIENTATION=+